MNAVRKILSHYMSIFDDHTSHDQARGSSKREENRAGNCRLGRIGPGRPEPAIS